MAMLAVLLASLDAQTSLVVAAVVHMVTTVVATGLQQGGTPVRNVSSTRDGWWPNTRKNRE